MRSIVGKRRQRGQERKERKKMGSEEEVGKGQRGIGNEARRGKRR